MLVPEPFSSSRDSEIAPTGSRDSEIAPTGSRDSEIAPTEGFGTFKGSP